jgi:aldehyde dehydrogenase (NAD+)
MSNAQDILRDLGIRGTNPGGSTGSGWWSGQGGAPLLQSLNPASGEIIAGVHPCSLEDYQRIVNDSLEAFRHWRLVPRSRRRETVKFRK